MSTPHGRWRNGRRPRFEETLCVFLLCLEARAEPVRVVVSEPAGADAVVAEVATRVRAELSSHAFDVVALTVPAGSDPREQVEVAGIEPPPIATLSIVRLGQRPAVDVWVHDRLTGKTLVKRLELGTHPDANVTSALAIHAVELLRASLLETRTTSEVTSQGRRVAPVPSEVTEWVDRAVEPQTSAVHGLSVSAGGAVVHSFAGIGPTVGPLLRVTLGLPSGVGGRLSVVGPLFGANLEKPEGSAFVRQEFLLAELVYAPSEGVFSPIASLGAGGYHLYTSGQPNDPRDQASKDEAWAALLDAGFGLAVRLGRGAFVFVDLHAFVTEPGPEVAIANARIGPVGRPSFVAAVGLQSRL